MHLPTSSRSSSTPSATSSRRFAEPLANGTERGIDIGGMAGAPHRGETALDGEMWCWGLCPVKMCQFSKFLFGKPENQTLISGKSHLCFTVKGRCLFLHSVNYVATFLAFIAGAMTGRQSEELPTQTAWTKSPACSSSIKDTLTHWTIVIFLPKLCAERVATSQTPWHRFLQFFLTNQTKCPKEYNDTTKSAPNWSALDIL